MTVEVADSGCDESSNSQTGFQCEELMLTDGEDSRYVTCSDADIGILIFSASIKIGDTFELSDPTGQALPDNISCTIQDPTTGSVIQIVTFDAGVDATLSLNDQFGSFLVKACHVQNQPLVSCVVPVVYTYTLQNTCPTTTTVHITLFERTRDGVTVDLTEQLEDENGDTAAFDDIIIVTEEEDVDICDDNIDFSTTLSIEATFD